MPLVLGLVVSWRAQAKMSRISTASVVATLQTRATGPLQH